MRKKVLLLALILGIVVFSAIVIPIIINELYLINSGYITVWQGADVLAFYGALLGAIGTVALGLVAWKQNERLLKLEEIKYTLEIQPFIMLTAWKTPNYRFYEPSARTVQIAIGNPNDANCALELSFSNTTNSFLTAEFLKLEYAYEAKSVDLEIGYIGSVNRKLVLQPSETGYITFIGTFDEFKNTCCKSKMKFKFMLENRFGNKFIEEFDAVIWLMKRPYENREVPYEVKIYSDNYCVREYKEESNNNRREDKHGQTENAHAE